MSNRIKVTLAILAAFASINSILALYLQSLLFAGPPCATSTCIAPSGPYVIYESLSIPISVGSWLAFGFAVVLWRHTGGNAIRSSMLKAGFDKRVYDLMIKMRGSGSRISILQTLMEAPRHRNELSQITGIDWKEVDRQVGLLERYGFVSVQTQAGPIKMYELTEQGILLVKLMDEMGKSQS